MTSDYDPLYFERPPFEDLAAGDFPEESYDLVELKYDGHFGQLLIEDGKWFIYAKSGNLRDCGDFKLDIGRTLIYSENLIGTEWAKHDNPDLYGKLACHSIIQLNGELTDTWPQCQMRSALEGFLKVYASERIVQRAFLVDQWPSSEAERIWNEYVLGKKYEGLVFKNSSVGWGPMGRMKATVTMDYVCLDVKPSTSASYAGWGAKSLEGGLYVDGELTRVCSVSGMTDEQRKDFLQNKDKYIGRVFECEGKKISRKGAVRHPNFLRWRDADDKRPQDCVWGS